MPWPKGWDCAPGRSKDRRISASSIRCCTTCSARPGSRPAASARTTRTWWSRARRSGLSSQQDPAQPHFVRIHAEKRDGTPVLTGTASVGNADGLPHELPAAHRQAAAADGPGDQSRPAGSGSAALWSRRSAWASTPTWATTIRSRWPTSSRSSPSRARGTRAESGGESPWGRPIIPTEMISVLLGSTSAQAGLSGRKPAVGLFAGQEIRLHQRAAVRRPGLRTRARDHRAQRKCAHRVGLGPHARLRCGVSRAGGRDDPQRRGDEGVLSGLRGRGARVGRTQGLKIIQCILCKMLDREREGIQSLLLLLGRNRLEPELYGTMPGANGNRAGLPLLALRFSLDCVAAIRQIDETDRTA